MNALALKQRIRDRLRYRKFELENIERDYRNTVNHAKLEAHTNQQIKRKEPGIQTLARKYNTLCQSLEEKIKLKKGPRGAIAPLPIEMDQLFKLDVDDDIWQDIGLTDNNDEDLDIPGWLGDECVRAGIKSLLELNRCKEERNRLISECILMRQWLHEEWVIVMSAIDYSVDDPDVIYQLNERHKVLLRLCNTWDAAIKIVPIGEDLPWGPDLAELTNARLFEFTESTTIQNVLEKPNLGVFGGEEFDEVQSNNDSEMMDKREEALMNEYDNDVDLLANDFSTHLHYEI